MKNFVRMYACIYNPGFSGSRYAQTGLWQNTLTILYY
jgi:hypothetical protein